MFSLKIAPSPWGIKSPSNTWYLRPARVTTTNRHLDRFSHFRIGPECYAVQCTVNWVENPQIAPSPLDFVTPPEEDGATTIGNMQKIGKDRACGSGDMLADRQTHTDAAEGEVISNCAVNSNKLIVVLC